MWNIFIELDKDNDLKIVENSEYDMFAFFSVKCKWLFFGNFIILLLWLLCDRSIILFVLIFSNYCVSSILIVLVLFVINWWLDIIVLWYMTIFLMWDVFVIFFMFWWMNWNLLFKYIDGCIKLVYINNFSNDKWKLSLVIDWWLIVLIL